MAQQPGVAARVACAVLAGAGIAGGAATGLIVADGLYPNGSARVPMVRPDTAAGGLEALIASAALGVPKLRAGRDSTLRPARRGHGRRPLARGDRRTRPARVARAAPAVPLAPSRTPSCGAPARRRPRSRPEVPGAGPPAQPPEPTGAAGPRV